MERRYSDNYGGPNRLLSAFWTSYPFLSRASTAWVRLNPKAIRCLTGSTSSSPKGVDINNWGGSSIGGVRFWVAEGTVGSCCFFLFPKRRIYRPDSLEMHLIAKEYIGLTLNLEWRAWDSLRLSWLSFDEEAEDERGWGDRKGGGDRSLGGVGLISEGRGDVIMLWAGGIATEGSWGKDPGIEGSSDLDGAVGLSTIGLSSTLRSGLDSKPAKTASKVPEILSLSVGGKWEGVDGPVVLGTSSFLKISSNSTFWDESALVPLLVRWKKIYSSFSNYIFPSSNKGWFLKCLGIAHVDDINLAGLKKGL